MAKAAKIKAPAGPSLSVVEFGGGNAESALAAAGAVLSAHQVHMIPVEHLRIKPGYNMRVTGTDEYREKIEGFTASMLSEGFLPNKPLSAVAGKDGEADLVFVTDGHGRMEAIAAANEKGAGIEAVPVILKPADTSDVDLTVALVTENTGAKPTAMEMAVPVQRLIKAKLSEQEIATRLGITLRYVQDLRQLIAAPKDVRDMLKSGRVSGTEGIRLVRKHADNPEKAIDAIRKMVASADARGAKRATRKDTEEGSAGGAYVGGVKQRKMVPQKTEWAVTAGQEFPLSDIRPFAKLLPDTDWYSLLHEKANVATATEDFRIQVIVTRPAKEKVEEAPPKKAKRVKAASAEGGALDDIAEVIGGEDTAGEVGLAAKGAEDDNGL